jgi:glycosyltransferase involved in cell wall biosynthesis
MNPAPRLGLIINTWNQPDYLDRALQAVSSQSCRPNEVLLADDGSDNRTGKIFNDWADKHSITSAHLWQEHQGFRRARVLNQAIAKAKSDYLVFLDGDTVPHPKFISDHRQLAQTQAFVQGHRALLKQSGSAWFGLHEFNADRRRAFWRGELQGIKQAFRWPCPWRTVRHDLRGVRGCNLAIWREHLIRVNGYNEAFVGWGREDSELAVRLMNLGIQRLDVRGWALCFHLWHAPANRTSLALNDELLARAQQTRTTRCEAGLSQYLHLADR